MPMIGETSTEFAGAEDLHPEEIPTSIDLIRTDVSGRTSEMYDLMGRRVRGKYEGVMIVNGFLVF